MNKEYIVSGNYKDGNVMTPTAFDDMVKAMNYFMSCDERGCKCVLYNHWPK